MRALQGIESPESVEGARLGCEAVSGRCAVASLRVRCMRSWRPFCCGLPGSMNSGRIPSEIHQDGDRASRFRKTRGNGRTVNDQPSSYRLHDRTEACRSPFDVHVISPTRRSHSLATDEAGSNDLVFLRRDRDCPGAPVAASLGCTMQM
jgi:hypothetical protein